MKRLLLITSVLALTTGVSHRSHGRIVGGEAAAPGQFPFMAAINDPDQFCNGVIISDRWILTSAQCISHFSPETEVYVGSHLNQEGGTSYGILDTVTHSGYDQLTLQNDIGLIHLETALAFSDTVQAIELDPVLPWFTVCTIAGWGVTDTEDYPDNLQYADVLTIEMDECKGMSEQNSNPYYLGPEQMCTQAMEGTGSCTGDAGGPLICHGKLSGIISYTIAIECGDGLLPDVFSSIASYADWIQEQIEAFSHN